MRIISVYNFFSKCDVYENLTGYKAPFQVPAFLFLPPYPVLSTSSLPWATPTVSPPSLLQDRRKRSPGTEGHHVTGRRIGPQEKKLPPPLLDPPPRDNSEGTIAHGLPLLHFPCSSSLCAQGRGKGSSRDSAVSRHRWLLSSLCGKHWGFLLLSPPDLVDHQARTM